ncbi:MAG: RNA methyltransferase [Candidatus Krumholzibacteriia bacterium]
MSERVPTTRRAGRPAEPAALDNIVVVLSHTTEPRNLGAAARALKTMGLRRLRLVRPPDHLGRDARAVAHGAEELLEQAILYDDVRDAVADIVVVAGTTCRSRQLRKGALLPPEALAARLAEHAAAGPVALLFGTERTGLTNDELNLCRYQSTVPMAQHQPSLNLAQSVMLYAWELRRACLAATATAAATTRPASIRGVSHPHRGTRLPSLEELDTLYAHLAAAMGSVGYSDAEKRKFLTYLRHLHQRAGIVNWELQIYHLLSRRILDALEQPRFRGLPDDGDDGA